MRGAHELIQAPRPRAVWGMNPFGGARDPVWETVDARLFLRQGQEGGLYQAALPRRLRAATR